MLRVLCLEWKYNLWIRDIWRGDINLDNLELRR